jgi:hypothetical protein
MINAVPLNSGAVVQAKASKIGNVVARGGESEWLQEAASMLGGRTVTELLSKMWQAQARDIALQ